MSEFLFDSLRVVPKAAEQAGFEYQFGSLRAALADLAK
jgi:NAD dependent epimerase/dehydratase family enzyme